MVNGTRTVDAELMANRVGILIGNGLGLILC